MKVLFLLTLVLSLPLGSKTLRCHSCVASNEEECYRQGTHVCPQYAEVCSTITAPRRVVVFNDMVWFYMQLTEEWEKKNSKGSER
ncbi:unnamed protein product [Ranitomeya imitator]|uniref:UPAR/Ly6 domain-containing protein n=1 Tax=Ranitomeya imitator TaxID=111125 RepID=A0ABN9MHH8_9NEOB|nr:unnamed protein product [Ranitomeya imitator]